MAGTPRCGAQDSAARCLYLFSPRFGHNFAAAREGIEIRAAVVNVHAFDPLQVIDHPIGDRRRQHFVKHFKQITGDDEIDQEFVNSPAQNATRLATTNRGTT